MNINLDQIIGLINRYTQVSTEESMDWLRSDNSIRITSHFDEEQELFAYIFLGIPKDKLDQHFKETFYVGSPHAIYKTERGYYCIFLEDVEDADEYRY